MDELKQLRSATAEALRTLAAKYTMSSKTESPIETILGASLSLLMEETLGEDFKVGSTGLEANFTLVPQYKLGAYRYDFAICVAGDALVLIECDGKDFHSSPEQVLNDANKDKFVAFNDKKIVRFTGSIINSHPELCAKDVISALVFEGKRKGYV